MPWTESILHVDMDAFFVEVERLDSAELRGRPVVVGGSGARGVVAAASYEARTFGVRSAMPMSRARRRCPDLVIVPPDHGRYRAVSEQVFAVFRSFTPLVEGLSLDEAFLDVAGLRRHYENPAHVAEAIRAEIRSRLRLPASVGIATNKFLAKLASAQAKPDGIKHITAGHQAAFLEGLDVRSLWGVGEATWAILDHLGVETVGDLARVPATTLSRRLGDAQAQHLLALAAGSDPRPVEPDSAAKSVSVEETYQVDISGKATVEAEILRHADVLGSRLRRSGLAARTVSIKIRYADFTTVSRSQSSAVPTNVGRRIYRIAQSLAARVDIDRPIRLVGVAATGLEPADGPRQLTVTGDDEWEKVADAVAAVRDRFGDDSVAPARLLGRRPET